jgi:hypothetical protein
MSPSSDSRGRDGFLMVLAVISFTADMFTLYQFVRNEVVLDFWTWRWLISIILVALLAIGGFLFLGLAGSEDVARMMLFLFGVLYILFALSTYLYWGFQQVNGRISVGDFLGFLVLSALLISIGLFGVGYEGFERFRYPSYGFATANLAYVFLLVNKYVLEGWQFEFWRFGGEMLILLIGMALFFGLYVASEN